MTGKYCRFPVSSLYVQDKSPAGLSATPLSYLSLTKVSVQAVLTTLLTFLATYAYARAAFPVTKIHGQT